MEVNHNCLKHFKCMNINKKYIIIFGTLILLLVIITGAVTYYKERVDSINVLEQDEDFSAPIPEDKKYEIGCYEVESASWNNCTEKTTFWPNQLVSISVNLKRFDNIPYSPYFLCYDTNLLKTVSRQCLTRSAFFAGAFSLRGEVIANQDKEIFTLLKLSVYPDDSFKESDEIVIMDIEGELTK